MTYAVAAVACALKVDPMAVLEWPPDVWQAVVETLNGTTPAHHRAQVEELKLFAGEFG